jgi:hypothetical protein
MLSARIKTLLKWLFILLWFAFASGLVIAMNTTTAKEFDHDNRLSIALMSMDFEQELVNVLRSVNPMRGDRVMHLTSGTGCLCQTLVQPHIEKINQLVTASDTAIITLNIDDYPELRKRVPSTPAIVVINKQEKLLYFGPYSQGSGCFSSAGAVDAVISRGLLVDSFAQSSLQQKALPNSMFSTQIVAEAKGCYCNQAISR